MKTLQAKTQMKINNSPQPKSLDKNIFAHTVYIKKNTHIIFFK